MFRTKFIIGNTLEKSFVRCYSNILTKINSLSKKIYYYPEYANKQKNLHKTWKIISSALPHKSTLIRGHRNNKASRVVLKKAMTS